MLLCALVILLTGCGADSEVKERRELARQKALKVQGQQLGSILHNANAGVSTGDDSLTIQLTFDADADLDLYVTDPLLETVYFANRESRSGGRISTDVSCDDLNGQELSQEMSQEPSEKLPAELSRTLRIEEVRYDAPLPGRYLIGIDYPVKCRDGKKRAAYAVSVRHNGELIQNSGAVVFEQFEVVVMEFEI